MKLFIALILLILSQVGWSQIKVSVSNGNWNDPQNWNPAVVPYLNEDSVIINHAITTQNTTEVGINHLIIGTNGSLNASSTFALHGSLIVDGSLHADTLLVGDGIYFKNNNLMEVDWFVTTNPTNENFGRIEISDTLILTEPFLNATNGLIETFGLITSSAHIENNGEIYADNWIHESTTDGTGRYCIQNCFKNIGNIGGTLDVCDLTPSTNITCDFNFGTISPTVTLCSNGYCEPTSGQVTIELFDDIALYPNPTSGGQLTLLTDLIVTEIKVYDVTGRLMIEQEINTKLIDISSLDAGEYLFHFVTANGSITKRIVKSN
ncbi:MAG: T9SS type A sorting domain-containing protein [Crocinitomicaceae bacterium]|nr:T9SS type A sorting domain-containing protein [Flavobacteriales bacterium]NQZ35491.1 T9SS type A sorting domain-containing protein [Crocinitomicaceae bacterium]